MFPGSPLHLPSREDEGWQEPDNAPVLVDRSEVGVDKEGDLIDVDGDLACQPCGTLPEPRVPTKAEVDRHNCTHLPYRSWCKWCVMARRPNTHHRSRLSSRRALPLLVADYCYLRDVHDEFLAKVLIARLYPARAVVAIVCASKTLGT